MDDDLSKWITSFRNSFWELILYSYEINGLVSMIWLVRIGFMEGDLLTEKQG